MRFDFDVIVIGAGIIGTSIGDELSKTNLKIAIFEKNVRVAQETSEGNSGVIHGGFDASPNKINATLNIQGRKIYENDWFKSLDFPWKKIDSLVLAFNEIELKEIDNLYQRGLTNGINAKHLQKINKEQVLLLEPNVNRDICGALLCTASYIVDPVLLTQALMNRFLKNKGQLFLNHKVIKIQTLTTGFKVFSLNEKNQAVTYTSQYIINAAGHYADEVAHFINCYDFSLKTRRGQYCILEKTESSVINNHILFMVPNIHGKGVIVAPMTDGHVLVGPTAVDNVAKTDTRLITITDINVISNIGLTIIPTLNMNKICKVLSGSRTICVETDDFVISPATNNSNFINVAGIKSPGLSAAPAIAQMVANMIKIKT